MFDCGPTSEKNNRDSLCRVLGGHRRSGTPRDDQINAQVDQFASSRLESIGLATGISAFKHYVLAFKQPSRFSASWKTFSTALATGSPSLAGVKMPTFGVFAT